MNPILLDTNAYAAFRRGHPEAIAVVQRVPQIALNTIVLGELLGGFSAGNREQPNRAELAIFLSSPRVVVLAVDRHTSEHYSSIYASLRRAGHPIPTNDMWIAASAVQHAFQLFTFDQHFKQVPGLFSGSSLAELTGP